MSPSAEGVETLQRATPERIRRSADGSRRFRRGRIGGVGPLKNVFAQNHNVDAPVLRTALGRLVGGDRVILGVAGRRQALRRELIVLNQKAHEFGRAGR